MTKLALQIGYRSYLLSATDAAKVMDILASAVCVETDWISDASVTHEVDPDEMSIKPHFAKVVSREEYRAMRDARNAAYQAERDAQRAAEEASQED